MSNLLLNDANWKDFYDNSQPPNSWNGAEYQFTYSSVPDYEQVGLMAVTAAGASDVLQATVTAGGTPPPMDGIPLFANVIDQNTNLVMASYGPFTTATSANVNFSLPAGSMPALYICGGADHTMPDISYHGTITITPTGPAKLGPPIQKQNRLLAYLYADTVLDMFPRTDFGAMDLTGYELQTWIHPYQRPQPWGVDYGPGMAGYYVPWQTQLPAEQVAIGHVQTTIDHGTIRARLGAGLWRLHLVAINPTTQARTRVYTALLTIQ